MAEKLCKLRTKGGGGGAKQTETVLWTNSAPTSNFAAQTVTLSDSIGNYKYVKIVYSITNTTSGQTDIEDVIYPVDDFRRRTNVSGNWSIVEDFSSGGYQWTRTSGYVSDTSISMGNCYRWNTSSSGTMQNQAIIPLEILGLNELDHGGMIVDALWTNPSPTTAFAAQTVSLDLSNYDAVLIDGVYGSNYAPHSGQPRANTFYIEKGQSYDACYGWVLSGNLWVTYRNTAVNANGVVFGGGYYYNNTTRTAQDSTAVPMAIYGVKNKLA